MSKRNYSQESKKIYISTGETVTAVSPGELKMSVKSGLGLITVPAKPIAYKLLSCPCLLE